MRTESVHQKREKGEPDPLLQIRCLGKGREVQIGCELFRCRSHAYLRVAARPPSSARCEKLPDRNRRHRSISNVGRLHDEPPACKIGKPAGGRGTYGRKNARCEALRGVDFSNRSRIHSAVFGAGSHGDRTAGLLDLLDRSPWTTPATSSVSFASARRQTGRVHHP